MPLWPMAYHDERNTNYSEDVVGPSSPTLLPPQTTVGQFEGLPYWGIAGNGWLYLFDYRILQAIEIAGSGRWSWNPSPSGWALPQASFDHDRGMLFASTREPPAIYRLDPYTARIERELELPLQEKPFWIPVVDQVTGFVFAVTEDESVSHIYKLDEDLNLKKQHEEPESISSCVVTAGAGNHLVYSTNSKLQWLLKDSLSKLWSYPRPGQLEGETSSLLLAGPDPNNSALSVFYVVEQHVNDFRLHAVRQSGIHWPGAGPIRLPAEHDVFLALDPVRKRLHVVFDLESGENDKFGHWMIDTTTFQKIDAPVEHTGYVFFPPMVDAAGLVYVSVLQWEGGFGGKHEICAIITEGERIGQERWRFRGPDFGNCVMLGKWPDFGGNLVDAVISAGRTKIKIGEEDDVDAWEIWAIGQKPARWRQLFRRILPELRRARDRQRFCRLAKEQIAPLPGGRRLLSMLHQHADELLDICRRDRNASAVFQQLAQLILQRLEANAHRDQISQQPELDQTVVSSIQAAIRVAAANTSEPLKQDLQWVREWVALRAIASPPSALDDVSITAADG